jgi:hypothetical protein
MELSTDRLEASARIQESSFDRSTQGRRPAVLRRKKPDPQEDDELLTQQEEGDSHQLDDLA